MRCTRCDGLAVPQAVGIDPKGAVVFGWCVPCLASKNCQLVEIDASGPWDLKLSFVVGQREMPVVSEASSSAQVIDQSSWIVALVAFLMVSWGLILIAAGLFGETWSSSSRRPPGSGTSPLLGIGGGATALLGLGLMVFVSRRSGSSGTLLLLPLGWLSFLASVGMLGYAILDYQPRRNLPVLLGAGLALAISAVSRLLERSRRSSLRASSLAPPPNAPAAPGWAKASGAKRMR
jgi:hypothetical protein